MAHALYGYDGLCKNIHGHSYRLWVTVIGEVKNDEVHKSSDLGSIGENSETKVAT